MTGKTNITKDNDQEKQTSPKIMTGKTNITKDNDKENKHHQI